ncbi:MAG: hypothetical protein EPN62_00790 [Candidimonas sp.]|nr:MAG: hypothetical protein EPN77_01790 [Candidimonas sp.]TAM26867.1 MAG: hypothetical protein EPN62_00790 [Candidimonas sp.]
MSAILPDITEDDAIRILGVFITSIVDCEVVRGQDNRVPMPKGDFILMTPAGTSALSTNTDDSSQASKTVTRPTKFTIRIDSYGAKANERAMAIATLLRDDYACQSFKNSGLDIQPLYAGDAIQMPLISGEQQYVERWTFEAVLQYNPTLTVAQDSADTLTVGLINVDADYKP